LQAIIGDIQTANGLLMVSYNGNDGGWDDTAGAYDYTKQYSPNENYVTNEVLPWSTIPYTPYQFVIDLETRNVLGKDTSSAQMTAAQILALVQANNE
jgi:hypothetical protein